MAEIFVKEQSTCYVTVVPRDKNGDAEQPTAANYWVHDVKSGEEVVGVTVLTPSASMEIELKGATVNALIDGTRKTEKRRVTVQCDYGSDDELWDEFIYTIKALEGAS